MSAEVHPHIWRDPRAEELLPVLEYSRIPGGIPVQ
jgi:hypothetical protein